MKSLQRLSATLIILIFAFGNISCKRSNDTGKVIQNSEFFAEILEDFAKFLGWNLNRDDRVRGVYRETLQASQALPAYISYEFNGQAGRGNKTISFVQTFSSPNPESINSIPTWNTSFADGSLAEIAALGLNIHSVPATEYTRTYHDASGNEIKQVGPYDKWVATFNDKQLTTLITTKWDGSADQAYITAGQTWYKMEETFEANPLTDGAQSDYQTGSKWYNESGTLIAEQTVARTGTEIDNFMDVTSCYGSNGASGAVLEAHSLCNSQAKQIVTYQLTDNIYTQRIQNYDISDKEISNRSVVTTTYEEYALRHPSSILSDTYSLSIDGVTATLQFKNNQIYTQGILTTLQGYDVSSDGSATAKKDRITATLNSSNRYEEVTEMDGSGDTFFRHVYGYDSGGRLNSFNVYYTPTGGAEEADPYCGGTGSISTEIMDKSALGIYVNSYSFAISWENTSAGKKRSVDYYCNGTTYSSTPLQREVKEYDVNGQHIKDQTYTCLGATCLDDEALLIDLAKWEYSSDLTLAKYTGYFVDPSGDAGFGLYTRYFYDDNLFYSHTVVYDAFDNILSTNYPKNNFIYP